MNTLGYREVEDECGVHLEFLVDGKPVGSYVDDDSLGGLSCWDLEVKLPDYPDWPDDPLAGRQFVSICHCGEWGCGSLCCEVAVGPDVVTWRRFAADSEERAGLEFTFGRSDYDRVMAAVLARAAELRMKKGS